MIKFNCSKCGEGMEAPNSLYDDVLSCPKCNNDEVVKPSKPAASPPIIPIKKDVAQKNVPAKSTSGLGVASLVMGIIACLISIVPVLGIFGIPIAVIGIIIGFVGFLIALIGRKAKLGFPVSGIFVSILAIFVSVFTTLMTAKSIEAIVENIDSNINSALEETKSIEPEKNAEINKFKTNYINEFISLYDFEAKYYNTFLEEKVPGISFKLKNNGNKTLEKVKVLVYFKNNQGVVIAEEDYHPVLNTGFSSSDNKPLKPNYIWQMEKGKFYQAEKVPSEWQEGNAVAKIINIEFLE